MDIITPYNNTNKDAYLIGFRTATPLYSNHILEENDICFFNPLESAERIYALTDIPTLIKTKTLPTPGVCRIYANKIKWGNTYRTSQYEPTFTIPIPDTHLTLVLFYEGGGTPTIIHEQRTANMTQGVFRTPRCTIIAAPIYKEEWEKSSKEGTKLRGAPSAYSQAEAIVNGVHYATKGLPENIADTMKKYLPRHTITLSQRWLNKLADYHENVYSQASHVTWQQLEKQIGNLYSWDGQIYEEEEK